MPTLLRLLVFGLLLALPLRAERSLENARRAQALLDPAAWSEIIQIENTARDSRYPRLVPALVFEFAGVLWLYTDFDGTQSFSLHQNALAEEKADFAPLLRDIDPGFTRWSVVPAATEPAPRDHSSLRNGCFIESLAALRRRRMLALPMQNARLLSYYADIGGRRFGHTVLSYEVGGKLEIFDPTRPAQSRTVAVSLGADALVLARFLAGDRVVKARFLTIPATPAPVNVAARTESSRAGEPM